MEPSLPSRTPPSLRAAASSQLWWRQVCSSPSSWLSTRFCGSAWTPGSQRKRRAGPDVELLRPTQYEPGSFLRRLKHIDLGSWFSTYTVFFLLVETTNPRFPFYPIFFLFGCCASGSSVVNTSSRSI